jgi:hypothetical protein
MVVILKPYRLKVLFSNSRAVENILIYKYWLDHPEFSSKDLSNHFKRSEQVISHILTSHIKKYGMNKYNL